MALAAASVFFWSIWPPQQFQLFQPIGGVSAMVSPTLMRNGLSVVPREFFAERTTAWVPRSFNVPVIRPVAASSLSPAGKPFAAKLTGRWPVAGTVKRKGEPGRTPKIFGPLIRGSAGGLGVRISAVACAISGAGERGA